MDHFKLVKFSPQVYNVFLEIQDKIKYYVLTLFIYIYISNVRSISPILIGPIMIIVKHEVFTVIE